MLHDEDTVDDDSRKTFLILPTSPQPQGQAFSRFLGPGEVSAQKYSSHICI